ITNDRVFPVFQPIINNKTGKIEKYETLMRIKDSDNNIITPAVFLTIAKKSKLYPELSRIIILKSFDYIRKLPFEFSLNFSVEDLMDAATMTVLADHLAELDKHKHFVVEILESEGIENYAEVSTFVEKMKAKGVKIAIDDFGTGYSNFAHILNLPFDYLKIDASLIKNILHDKNALYVVEAILNISNKIRFDTIAEYVHSGEVQSEVVKLGIGYSQGYYIGEPEFLKMLT
ncbi:MAG: EAL domain-containing protein, partial [Spirochaetota bacterium]